MRRFDPLSYRIKKKGLLATEKGDAELAANRQIDNLCRGNLPTRYIVGSPIILTLPFSAWNIFGVAQYS